MKDFKNSFLALMSIASNVNRVGKATYIPDRSLDIYYEDVILDPNYFSTESIFFIDSSQNSSLVNHHCHSVAELYGFLKEKSLVKINNIESYNNNYIKFCENLRRAFGASKVDCHIYFGKKNSFSFNFHQDPMGVLIYCLRGKKDIKLKKRRISLGTNDWVYLPKNTNHKAYYPTDSITLSFGIYK